MFIPANIKAIAYICNGFIVIDIRAISDEAKILAIGPGINKHVKKNKMPKDKLVISP